MTTLEQTAPLYRVSILATGFGRMWRAWRVIIPVVIINAVLQGLLLLPGILPYLSLAFIVVALLSLVVLIVVVVMASLVLLLSSQLSPLSTTSSR